MFNVFVSTLLFLSLAQLYRSDGNCGGDVFIDNGFGIVKTPNYPGIYPKNQYCVWKITVPEGYTVALTFESFSLNSNNNDYVDVHDGSENGRSLRRYSSGYSSNYSSSRPSAPLQSSGNKLSITFHSGSYNNGYNGFSAIFTKDSIEKKYGLVNGDKVLDESEMNSNASNMDRTAGFYEENDEVDLDGIVEEDVEVHGVGFPGIRMNRLRSVGLGGGSAFKEVPRDIEAVTGRSIQLNCSLISGRCLRLIQWTHNGKELNGERYSVLASGELRISNVSIEDSGNYTCHVETATVEASQSTILNVQRNCGGSLFVDNGFAVVETPNYPSNYPPNTICTWNLSVPEGYRVALQFQSFNVEYDENCMMHDYVVIRQETGRFLGRYCGSTLPSDTLHSSSNKLSITFTSDNSSEYTGFSAVFMKVEAPEFQERPRNVETITGRSVNFTCRTISGRSPRFIQWTLNGNELNGERYSIRANGDLLISNVDVEDSGNYTCRVKNEIYDVSASAILIVRRQTIIGKHRGTYEVSTHGSISMICAISEKDEALQTSIHWTRKDEMLNSSHPRVFIVNSKSGNSTLVSELTITNVSRSDEDFYGCTAKTKLDADTDYFWLRVTPQLNRLLIRDVECLPRDAKISWSPFNDDEASTSDDYFLHYEIKTTDSSRIWKKVAIKVSAVDRDYLVPMRFGTKYRFRISDCTAEDLPNLWCSYINHECTAVEAVPSKNPENVMAKVLRDPASLVISWTPLPENDHQAHHLYYEIWYKPNLPKTRWEKSTVQDWRQGEYAVNVSSNLEEYAVMVVARNAVGRANGTVPKVIGCSVERETRLLNDLDDTANMMNDSIGGQIG